MLRVVLDFIYYPVSGIMWVWHWLFSYVTPASPGGDGIAWALSVVFLVFTLRAILYKPFVKQIRTTKKMQAPGAITYQGACRGNDWACLSILPQVAAGGWTPSPR